jgi:hypothetical protein
MSVKKGFLRLTVVLSTLLPCIAIIHILAMPTLYSFEFKHWWIVLSVMLLSPVGFLILWAIGLTIKYIAGGFMMKDTLMAEKESSLAQTPVK